MAGIKITDLSALSVAESGDYLCIVDVSDTSQSPAGTTKKIEVGNVGATSGTWTCTLGGATNVLNLVVVGNSTYFRIGNFVQGTIRVQCLTTDAIEGSFGFDLPVLTTPFPNTNSMHCTIGMINPTADINKYTVTSQVGEVRGEVTVLADGDVVVDAVITFNYLVA